MKLSLEQKCYFKKLYFRAGQSVMDNCCEYMKQYIDYKLLNKIYLKIQGNDRDTHIVLDDCYGAFFNTLCTRLVKEQFYADTVITVADPYFSKNIICLLIVPARNLSVINENHDTSSCKAYKLYSVEHYKNGLKNLEIATDFFKKSHKYK